MRHWVVLMFVVATAALSLGLFSVKYQVHDLEDDLVALNKAIVAERQTLHVLEAEWSYLNDPARLRELAERHLDLAPVAAGQMADMRDVPLLDDDTAAGRLNTRVDHQADFAAFIGAALKTAVRHD